MERGLGQSSQVSMQELNVRESESSRIGAGHAQGRFRHVDRLHRHPRKVGQGDGQTAGSRADVQSLRRSTRSATGPLPEPFARLQGQHFRLGTWHQNIPGNLDFPVQKGRYSQQVLERFTPTPTLDPRFQLEPVFR